MNDELKRIWKEVVMKKLKRTMKTFSVNIQCPSQAPRKHRHKALQLYQPA
jgi:hypothetical protein